MTRKPAGEDRRYWLRLAPALGIVGLAAGVCSQLGAEVSTYSMGAGIYAEQGCGACHESVALAPIERSRKPAPHVFEKWIDATELSERIQFGDYKSADYAVAQRSIPRKLKMPAYNDRISESDLRALVVFVQVNQLVHAPSTSDGQNLSRKYGCFNCHGPLGLGGVDNPQSFKGYIPGWFGRDFDELTNGGDRESVAEWIQHGTSAAVTGKSLGRGSVARYFGERQTIKMPSFDRWMTTEDLAILVDYVLLLRDFGDMHLPEVERYKNLYAVDTEAEGDRSSEDATHGLADAAR